MKTRLLSLLVPLAIACSQSDVSKSEMQLGANHVRIGFGVTTFSDDALHLDDSGFATVTKYLDHLHSDHVHMRVPWCRMEPKAGVYESSTFTRVQAWTKAAIAGGQDILISIDTHAPYFARRDALQRDDGGNYFNSVGCGKPQTGSYPDGDPAPEYSTEAYEHFGASVGALLACLRGDKGNVAGCTPGTNLLSHVMLEVGDETNWGANWQTGQCESGKRWYETGIWNQDKSCKNGNGDIGRIDPTDADLFGEIANYTAQIAHASYGFDRVSLGGVFMHSGDWGTNHPDGTKYISRIYDRVEHPDLWKHVPGHAWDKVALHFGGGCGDPHTTPWNGCSGSMKERIDDVRAMLRDKENDGGKAIWITGLLDDGSGGEQAQSDRLTQIWKGITSSYCGVASHPITMVKFARLPDPNSTSDLSHIGFLKTNDAANTDPKSWTPKQDYKDMGDVLAKNCE